VCAARGKLVGFEALEFHSVGAALLGRVDKLQGHIERAIMIDAGFGDDKDT
jgi:hypothetical protein